MNKRQNRSYFIFSLVLVFMLIGFAAAFFTGVKVGQERAEARFAIIWAKNEEAARKPGAYDQQHLVSFYHTVFAPYREYHNLWFEKRNELENSRSSASSARILKELNKAAEERYKEIQQAVMPDSSPLLVEAHQNVLKSLKLFGDSVKAYEAGASSMTPGTISEGLEQLHGIREAMRHSLTAQEQYYTAIVKWNQTIDPRLKDIELADASAYTVQDWSRFGLNMKNWLISSILRRDMRFSALYPQDLTVRVDEWIVNGRAKQLSLNDLTSIVTLLDDTQAARKGDFTANKEKWYTAETIPQLPFFYEDR